MKILVAYDGSGHSRSSFVDLQYAGLPSRADILILSVSEVWMPPTTRSADIGTLPDGDVLEYFRRCYEQADRNLAETNAIAAEARDSLQRLFPAWNIKTETVTGSPAAVILSRASQFKPDLIALGSLGLSSNGTGGLGSIAQKILIEANCPVRIARRRADVQPAEFRVVIGFNNTPGSFAAVNAVVSRRWSVSPEIRLVMIADPLFPLIPGRAFHMVPNWSQEAIDRGESSWTTLLAAPALRKLSTAGLSAKLFVYSGNPRMIMTREAEAWGATSLFVGANSFPDIQGNSLGTVALAVADRASCSVEVIRSST
jgi:nucleotide-binding universal stress UspA family protein